MPLLAAPLDAQSLAQLEQAGETSSVSSSETLENLTSAGRWADANAGRSPNVVNGEASNGERISALNQAPTKRSRASEPIPAPLAEDNRVVMGCAKGFAWGASWVMAPAAYLGSFGGVGKIVGAALGCLLFLPAVVAGLVTWAAGMGGTAPVLRSDWE